MDPERALVSKAIQTGEVDEIVSLNIKPDHFADEEVREVWRYVERHLGEYGGPPTLDAVRHRHKDFKLELDGNTLSYILDRFVKDVKRRTAIKLGRDFAEAVGDPDRVGEIELVAIEMARHLTEMLPSQRVHRLSDAKDRIRESDRMREAGESPGTPINIPTVDALTAGMRPHEFWVILAFLGVGKSTLMQWILYQLYLNGSKPLMISLEMSGDELLERFDSMAAHVRHRALVALEIDPKHPDRRKLEEWAERADGDRHERDIMIRDDIYDCTVDRVQAEVFRWKPDLVAIDYIGLMSAPGGPSVKRYEKVQENTRRLKAMARSGGVPILGAAQANREGARDLSIDNTAESIGIAQDCDVCIGLEQQDEEQQRKGEIEALLLKNRKGKKKARGIRLNFDLENGFDIYEITRDMLMRPRDDRVPRRKADGGDVLDEARQRAAPFTEGEIVESMDDPGYAGSGIKGFRRDS